MNNMLVTKTDIIGNVTETLNAPYKFPRFTRADIKKIFDLIVDEVNNAIISVNPEKNVRVNLSEGFYITSEYQKEKQKQNNLTGETIKVAPKIKIKAEFTRPFKEKLQEALRYQDVGTI